MAIMLEMSIKFFFDNFAYCFGGKKFLQGSGRPIRARLTLAISRLVMQEWWDQFEVILTRSDIKWRLRAIYVDYSMIIEKIMPGTRYCKVSKKFIKKNEFLEEDIECDRESLTERAMREAMCDVSSDLDFTTET